MINGNQIKFGYGDIAVCAYEMIQEIGFQQFEPQQECGSSVNTNAVRFIGETIYIKLCYNSYQEFMKLLAAVESKEITSFEFEGYVFDFTNYNEKSIEVCKRNARLAISLNILALAC